MFVATAYHVSNFTLDIYNNIIYILHMSTLPKEAAGQSEDPKNKVDSEKDQGEAQRQRDADARRAELQRDMEKNLQQSGNLTAQEIKQLMTFEWKQAPSTVEEQLQKYFLQLKDWNPARATALHAEIQPLLRRGVKTLEDVKAACEILRKYWSGFILVFNGESYDADFFPSHIAVQPIETSTKTSPKAKFGGRGSFESAMNEVHVEDVLSALMRQERRKFALRCPEGGSFLGAVVGGRTITWLQYGRVFSYDEEIGTYDDQGVQGGNRNMVISVIDNIGVEPEPEQIGTLQGKNLRDVVYNAKRMSSERNRPISFVFEGIPMTVNPRTSEYEIISLYSQQRKPKDDLR